MDEGYIREIIAQRFRAIPQLCHVETEVPIREAARTIGRVDVVVVRKSPACEIIVIEAKAAESNVGSSFWRQISCYGSYANEVYLALPQPECSQAIVRECLEKRVGLLGVSAHGNEVWLARLAAPAYNNVPAEWADLRTSILFH